MDLRYQSVAMILEIKETISFPALRRRSSWIDSCHIMTNNGDATITLLTEKYLTVEMQTPTTLLRVRHKEISQIPAFLWQHRYKSYCTKVPIHRDAGIKRR